MRYLYTFTLIILFSVCAKAQAPAVIIGSASPLICTGRPFTFSASGDISGGSFHWSIKPSHYITIAADSTSSSITYTAGNAGTYTVTVIASGATTTHTTSRIFNVNRSATAAFNASLSSQGFPAQLSLTDYSTNNSKHYWIFNGDFFDKDSSATLIKNYSSAGSYDVLLIAKAANGCSDTSHYNFRLSDSSGVTLPNIFSPNGDGINDVFRPITRGMEKMNAWVYNRNGVMLASWERLNGFWDGYTTSGEPCVAGEYFVVIEATGFDGKKYKLKGNLTLVR